MHRPVLRALGSRHAQRAIYVGLPLGGAAAFDASSGPVAEEQLPRTYEPAAIASIWVRRPIRVVKRACSVLGELVPFGAGLAIDYGRGRLDDVELQVAHARALRESLIRLGPAFVKLGQAMSVRPDVLPRPALKEMERLVDSVPSFPDELARAIVFAELGRPFDELFDTSEFGAAPVAAASLGQVYRVRERSSGDVLAVKVQRPDMMAAISLDLQILMCLASALDGLTSVFTRQQPYHRALLATFAEAAWSELDYEQEASNQERFRRNFQCEGLPRADCPQQPPAGASWRRLVSGARSGSAESRGQIYIPRVYREHTARRVLATEWVEGCYLARSPPDVIARLVPVGIACFLQQLLEDGFFHCDPHPGNLIVTTDGRLALIDFGLCARVPLPDTSRIGMAIMHTMEADISRLLEDAVALGFLPEDVDRERLEPLLRRVLATGTDAVLREQAAQREERQQQRQSAAKLQHVAAVGGVHAEAGASDAGRADAYGAVHRRRRHLRNISDDLNDIFFRFPFRVPDYFALITRALVVLEGIALTGDPHFDLLEGAFPWVARHVVREALEGRGGTVAAGRAALAAAASPERAAAELALKLAASRDVVVVTTVAA